MKIQCKIELSDYLKATYVHYRPRPFLKWIRIAFAAFLIFIALQQFFLPAEDRDPMIFYLLGGVVLWIALKRLWISYSVRKIYKQQKMLREPYEAEIANDALTVVNSNATCRTPWEDFHKYKLGNGIALLYHSDVMFQMFLKRWFTDDEFDDLLIFLREKLGPPKR